MRRISARAVTEAMYQAIRKISFEPDPDITRLLREAQNNESSPLARDALSIILENHRLSPTLQIPLCQDTGSTILFAEIGIEACLAEPLSYSLNRAIIRAQQEIPLRASIVQDPLFPRVNTGDNSPGIVHITQVEGDGLRLTIGQKGGGAENMSFLKMFTPAASANDIVEYITAKVLAAHSRPCPPLILGIGIGGNFETSPLLAKRALFEKLGRPHPDPHYCAMEEQITKGINAAGCGVQGLGGNHTVLATHILSEPCHIASLPVAVNVQCHAHRHITVEVSRETN